MNLFEIKWFLWYLFSKMVFKMWQEFMIASLDTAGMEMLACQHINGIFLGVYRVRLQFASAILNL